MRSVSWLGFAFTSLALAASCTIIQSPGTPGYVSSATATMEVNVDRPGSDYRSFDLGSGRPEECRDTCLVEPQCQAFTFVNPGVQGPSARCWLKSSAPLATPSGCCISGVRNASPTMAGAEYGQPSAAPVDQPPQPAPVAPTPPTYVAPTPPSQGRLPGEPPGARRGMELGVDRQGADYANFDLPQAHPHLCKEACMRDAQCRAFTYVNPGVQGPNARCWLKMSVPPGSPSSCCISGVK